jgi:outer membrane protein assembly factor BamB
LNISAFLTRHRLVGAAILLIVLLTACGPAPLGTSWAALSTVGEEQNILVAFGNDLIMVNPVDGTPIQLTDPDGEPLLDDQGNPRLWHVKGSDHGGAQFYSSPIVTDENTLLVAGYNNHFFEVDISRARVENPSGEPILAGRSALVVADLVSNDDLLYVPLSGHNLLALNREDLSVRWEFMTAHGVWSPPLVVDGVAYFASLDHFLYAVDAETGDEIWRLDLQGAAISTPLYQDGHLYIGSFARKIFDISVDGEILNEYATRNWVWSSPVLVDGILYAADLGGWVYALNAQEGLSERWAVQVATAPIRPSPIVVDDTVIVASRHGPIYWLDPDDGTVIVQRDVKREVFSDLLLVEANESLETPQLVVVSTMSPDALLVAYTVDSGACQWVYGTAEPKDCEEL